VRWFALVVALAACTHGARDNQLVDVTRGDLVIGVEVIGELEAVDKTEIKPPPIEDMWDFKIANLAPEGQQVKKGDMIIEFDASDQMRLLEEMQNEADGAVKALAKKRDSAALERRDEELKIAEAEATLRKASLKTNAPSDLVASIQQKELELDAQAAELGVEDAKNRADQAVRADTAELEQLGRKASYAQHRVEELQQDIVRLRVTSPRDGTVVYPMNQWNGEKHKVGDSVWRMEEVLHVVALDKMEGDGQVDEVDIARVTEKQRVSLRVDALPDVLLRGSVKWIAKGVQAKSKTDPSKVVKLVVELEPTNAPLRPGMRFRGEAETETLPGVVQVPVEAVFVTADGPVAYRETGSGLEKVKLTLGRRTPAAIEVKAGLAPGDRVSRIDPEAAR
jgi:multidrug efflux pump subunit AcrA (membrane-fusion protein)